MKYPRHTFMIIGLAVAGMGLLGCPRVAYIALYNNSGRDWEVFSSGKNEGRVRTGAILTFQLGGHTFELSSQAQRWVYSRNIPDGGEDGLFFDGRLRLQIEPDGSLFALKKGQVPPLTEFDEQPPGFPLVPNQPNKSPEPTRTRGASMPHRLSPLEPAISSEERRPVRPVRVAHL